MRCRCPCSDGEALLPLCNSNPAVRSVVGGNALAHLTSFSSAAQGHARELCLMVSADMVQLHLCPCHRCGVRLGTAHVAQLTSSATCADAEAGKQTTHSSRRAVGRHPDPPLKDHPLVVSHCVARQTGCCSGPCSEPLSIAFKTPCSDRPADLGVRTGHRALVVSPVIPSSHPIHSSRSGWECAARRGVVRGGRGDGR